MCIVSWLYENALKFHIAGGIMNQPKFCPSATWNATGITFANNNTVGILPFAIHVTKNNTVYVANQESSVVQKWLDGNSIPTTGFVRNNSYPRSIFVATNEDIYVDNGGNSVARWKSNQSANSSILYTIGRCLDLFIDKNNYLYCSVQQAHQVIFRYLNESSNQYGIAAGGNCYGFLNHLLYSPRGIFVDDNLNFLYVADMNNHRVQRFPIGQLNGTTVAGSGAVGTIDLYAPADVVLDADGYVYIVDQGNHRVVAAGPNGFRCIVGCSSYYGLAPNTFNSPQSMAFDSRGNIFVVDQYNHRIQKFFLATNSCGEYYDRK
jgi:hypothetical protein